MFWIFLSVVLVLAVYSQGFRRGCLTLIVLAACGFGYVYTNWSNRESPPRGAHAAITANTALAPKVVGTGNHRSGSSDGRSGPDSNLAVITSEPTENDASESNNRRTPDMSHLDADDQDSIESVCSGDKILRGPLAYNRCLNDQLVKLERSPKRPSLAGLSIGERESIESVCSGPKILKGPAAYNRCLIQQLNTLKSSN